MSAEKLVMTVMVCALVSTLCLLTIVIILLRSTL